MGADRDVGGRRWGKRPRPVIVALSTAATRRRTPDHERRYRAGGTDAGVGRALCPGVAKRFSMTGAERGLRSRSYLTSHLVRRPRARSKRTRRIGAIFGSASNAHALTKRAEPGVPQRRIRGTGSDHGREGSRSSCVPRHETPPGHARRRISSHSSHSLHSDLQEVRLATGLWIVDPGISISSVSLSLRGVSGFASPSAASPGWRSSRSMIASLAAVEAASS